jgi:hypothetical protein
MDQSIQILENLVIFIQNEIGRISNLNCNDKTYQLLKQSQLKAIELSCLLDEARIYSTSK